jgi:putative addiction module component (TIGR02574 family)
MSQITPQISEVLEKAMALSSHDRGLIIDRLIATLDDQPLDEGVEASWDAEIKRRLDDIDSGKAKMISMAEFRRRREARRRDAGL